MTYHDDDLSFLVDPIASDDDGLRELADLAADSVAGHPSLQVAVDFADVARGLHEQGSTQETLQRIVEYAVEVVDGCQAAGITVTRNGQPRTVASTSPLVLKVDALQYETGEGPCLDAVTDHAVYRTGDLAADGRWPLFTPGAVDAGVRSMLSFRLYTQGETLGGLNLYSGEIDAFSDGSFAIGVVLAVHASTAFALARRAEETDQLRAALRTNRLIGTAVGIVMASEGIDADSAMALLAGESSRRNLKLAQLADAVVQDRGLVRRA